MYDRKVPAKDAALSYVDQVTQQLNRSDYRKRNADDVENIRVSHQVWRPASEFTTEMLDSSVKEPRMLIFFIGAVYELTFNDTRNGKFCHSQLAIMTELPRQQDLDGFKPIKLLVALWS